MIRSLSNRRERGRVHITKKGRGLRYLISLFVVAALSWCAGFLVFVSNIPNPIHDEAPVRAAADFDGLDGIVVLTGGALRLKTGLKLLEAGAAAKLFVSGVHRGVDVEELLRVSRQEPDTVACCIELGHEANDTRGNALESTLWAERLGYENLLLVTADYHMPRALLEFAILAPNLTVKPYPVFSGNVRTDQWYKFPGTALFIAGEYSKTVLALMRYGVSSVRNQFFGS